VQRKTFAFCRRAHIHHPAHPDTACLTLYHRRPLSFYVPVHLPTCCLRQRVADGRRNADALYATTHLPTSPPHIYCCYPTVCDALRGMPCFLPAVLCASSLCLCVPRTGCSASWLTTLPCTPLRMPAAPSLPAALRDILAPRRARRAGDAHGAAGGAAVPVWDAPLTSPHHRYRYIA